MMRDESAYHVHDLNQIDLVAVRCRARIFPCELTAVGDTPARAADLRDRLHAEPLQCGASRRRRPDRRSGPGRHRLCAVLPAWRFHTAAVVYFVRRSGAPRRYADASSPCLAPSALAEHSSDPGTSSVAHLRENLAAAELALPDDAIKELDHVVSIVPA
jgi:hypothetical protein